MLDMSLISHNASTDDNETVLSLGDGIEREVLHTIFEQFRKDTAQYFTSHPNGYATLTTAHTLTTARFVSTSRKRNMGVLGAATALCIINGISIHPIDPVLLHYFVHNCDINSIYPALLAEWHPELKKTISDWINLGPNGDPGPFQAHFATHNDIQVRII